MPRCMILIYLHIRKFFKSDSEIFLTLKNGLEAGSCILQMFHMYVGMGEGGVFLLVYRLVESIYLLCLAVSRLKGV